jgi:hypothetical protein
MLKIFFIFLTFLSLSGLCQEGGGRVIIRENPAAIEAQRPVENSPAYNPDEDAEIDEKDQHSNLKIPETPELQFNFFEELEKLGYEELNLKALTDKNVQPLLQELMASNALKNESFENSKEFIKTAAKGKPVEAIFKKFPKTLDISADVLRDKNALPGLVSILGQKEKLKRFGIFWVVLFISGLIIKWKIIAKYAPLTRFASSIALSLVLTLSSLFLFYGFFTQELESTVSILSKHLF